MSEVTPTDRALFLQRFSSHVLWHFTGYGKSHDSAFSVLKSIVAESTLRVGMKHEPIHMPDQKTRYGYPVACMCDIPLADLRIHIERYGPFGIAFFKEAAVQFGHFNPLLYLHKDSPIFGHATKLVGELENTISRSDPLYKPLQGLLMLLGSFSKRSDLNHPAIPSPEKDIAQDNNFYYEREWRTIRPWKFSDSMVAAIMLPVAYIPRLREHLQGRLGTCSVISSEMVGVL